MEARGERRTTVRNTTLIPGLMVALLAGLAQAGAEEPAPAKAPAVGSEQAWHYAGTPFSDSVKPGGPQQVPGVVRCAWYDRGGEGVAYHDSDAKNNGSGALNPADGSYLNEFRKDEGVDISYTKTRDDTDTSVYDRVQPPPNLLYVGWTEPGEWFNMTIEVKKAGRYAIDLLYTSNRGGTIALGRDGQALTKPIEVPTTFDARDPIAWRQWHHWNLLKDAAIVELPAGPSVLTVHTLSGGNMNFATLEFRRLR
jgi:hypothetical protein